MYNKKTYISALTSSSMSPFQIQTYFFAFQATVLFWNSQQEFEGIVSDFNNIFLWHN